MTYVPLFALILLTACHNSKLDSGNLKKLLGSRDSSRSEMPAKDAESEVAVEPTSIGGAFLICAHDEALTSSTEHFGCRLEDESGKKLPSFLPKDDHIVAIHLDTVVAGKAVQNNDSFWHWNFAYKKTERAAYRVKLVQDIPYTGNRETMVLDIHPSLAIPLPKAPGSVEPPAPNQPPAGTLADPDSHVIFVTSLVYGTGGTGVQQFNSLATADAICNKHAAEAKLSGQFTALLGDAAQDATERVTLRGLVKLTDGQNIANMNTFWSTSHVLPILLDESGKTLSGGTLKVWSGSLVDDDDAEAETCNNWTDATVNAKAHYGLSDRTDTWFSNGLEGCDQKLRLYCISR